MGTKKQAYSSGGEAICLGEGLVSSFWFLVSSFKFLVSRGTRGGGGLEFAEEAGAVDDEADMGAFADDAVALHGDDVEGKASVVDVGELGGGDDLSTDGRGPQVADVDVGTDGGLLGRKGLVDGEHGRIFHEGNHDGCCQYGHVARAHCLGGVGVADKEDAGVGKHHFIYGFTDLLFREL